MADTESGKAFELVQDNGIMVKQSGGDVEMSIFAEGRDTITVVRLSLESTEALVRALKQITSRLRGADAHEADSALN